MHLQISERIKNLSLTQCLSIIEHYKPDEQRIGEIFGLSKQQLKGVRALNGVFKPDPTFDVTPYYPLFDNTSTIIASENTGKETFQTSKGKRKPGRPGNNIISAFWKVPNEPVDAIKFAETSNVSLSVLRQSKRFDKTNLPGKVHVRKNGEGVLMIWRDSK